MYWHTSAFEPPLHYGTCTYVAGRFGQYQDSSLDMSSIPDHSNNQQIHYHNWCSLLQRMILEVDMLVSILNHDIISFTAEEAEKINPSS